VGNKSVNHLVDLGMELVGVDINGLVFDVFKGFKFSLLVVDVFGSNFLFSSLFSGGGGVGRVVQFSDVWEILDGLGELNENESVFFREKMREFGESLDEGSVDFSLFSLGEVVVDVLFKGIKDVYSFHVFSELLDKEDVVVASLLFEFGKKINVGSDSVLSALFVSFVLSDLVLQEFDVGFQVLDVFLSFSNCFLSFGDLDFAIFSIFVVSDVGFFLLRADVSSHVTEKISDSVQSRRRVFLGGDERGHCK